MTTRPDPIQLGPFRATPRRHRMGELGQPEWYWDLRLRRDGADTRRSIGWCANRETASERALDAIQALREQERLGYTVDGSALLTTSLEAYLEHVETLTHLRPNTRRLRRFSGRSLLDWAEFEASRLRCSELTARHGHAYALWLLDHGYARSTINQLLTGARVFILWAGADWGVPEVKFRKLDPAPKTLRIPTAEEIDQVIACSGPQLGSLLTVMAYTGVRIGEALSRHGRDVDLRRRRMRIAERAGWVPKTRQSTRVVGLSDACVAAIEAMEPEPDRPIWRSHTKSPIRDYTGRLARAVELAQVEKLTFHDLRRHVSDRLRRAQVGVKVYQSAMGHSALTAMREYQLATEDEVLEAFSAKPKERK